jgi:hypothetical protein
LACFQLETMLNHSPVAKREELYTESAKTLIFVTMREMYRSAVGMAVPGAWAVGTPAFCIA